MILTQSRKRFLVVGFAVIVPVIGIQPCVSGTSESDGQVVTTGIEQRLHAFILERVPTTTGKTSARIVDLRSDARQLRSGNLFAL